MISTENSTLARGSYGQRYAVERHRTLGGDEAREFARGSQLESRHVGQIIARDDGRDTVGMAGDDMAAELVADFQRPFEVEPGADMPVSCRCHGEGFGGGVDLEPGPAPGRAGANDGEAHAAAGDRSAVDDAGMLVAAGDAQPMQPPLRRRRQRRDLANVGDYAGGGIRLARKPSVYPDPASR